MLLGGHPAHARCAALVDVAEQAWPADPLGPLEHPVAARANREHLEQLVDGAADGPGVGVGPEVPGALALCLAHDRHTRELVRHRDSQVGIGLVVTEFHVETWVVLLDPRVLEGERLDLSADHDPVDVHGGLHHRGRSRMQGRRILEVARQSGTQIARLSDIDHASVVIAKPVHPGIRGDRARWGAKGPAAGSCRARHWTGSVSGGRRCHPAPPRRRQRGLGSPDQRSLPRPRPRTSSRGTGR
ncbi:unannotated protein [freshwater metagenome]|uniref:Unannotated protein n=1 Tax=freshwater metagenome TaxID=449393 RepID=A0A6J7EEE1_9ZZZZ